MVNVRECKIGALINSKLFDCKELKFIRFFETPEPRIFLIHDGHLIKVLIHDMGDITESEFQEIRKR